jgi:hypothetical protein
MRHAEFTNSDFDFHPGVIDVAKDLLDPSHRLPIKRRGLGQLHDHDLPWQSYTSCSFWYEDVQPVTSVFGRHQPDTTFLEQSANNGLAGTLHDLKYTPLGTPFAIQASESHLDAILVEYRAHFIGRQINIGSAVVPDYKTMAITVTLNSAFNFL